MIEKEDDEEVYNIINNDIVNIPNEELKKISLSIEDKLYSLDKRIVNVPSAGLARYDFIKCIVNSNGVCKGEIKNNITYYAEVIAKDSNSTKTYFDVYSSKDIFFDIDSFTKNIADNVISKLIDSDSLCIFSFSALASCIILEASTLACSEITCASFCFDLKIPIAGTIDNKTTTYGTNYTAEGYNVNILDIVNEYDKMNVIPYVKLTFDYSVFNDYNVAANFGLYFDYEFGTRKKIDEKTYTSVDSFGAGLQIGLMKFWE